MAKCSVFRFFVLNQFILYFMDLYNEIVSLQSMAILDLIQLSLMVNLSLFVVSIAIYGLVHKFVGSEKYIGAFQPFRWADFWICMRTIVCNSIVFVVGVYLWKNHWVTIQLDASILVIVLQIGVLILVMDFLMYVFHRIAHAKYIYSLLHQKHHEHTRVNALSLFVLSPAEALGFGFFIIATMMCYAFSYQAVLFYLTLNVLWGTIGHFNLNLFPSIGQSRLGGWIGTATFHHKHHQTPQCNYGFYTTIWDKLAQTYKTL